MLDECCWKWLKRVVCLENFFCRSELNLVIWLSLYTCSSNFIHCIHVRVKFPLQKLSTPFIHSASFPSRNIIKCLSWYRIFHVTVSVSTGSVTGIIVQLVVKSQILAGGRGLGTFKSGLKGGVHIVKTDQVEDIAGNACLLLYSSICIFLFSFYVLGFQYKTLYYSITCSYVLIYWIDY